MTNLDAKWSVFAIVAMTLVLLTGATFAGAGPALAVKKSTTTVTAANHIKGVKLLHVHTYKPSIVAVGSTFSIRAIAFNNSSATITFTNGTALHWRLSKQVLY